jgi:hypothetical protein
MELEFKRLNRRTVTNDWREIVPKKDNSVKKRVSKKRGFARIDLK